MAAEKSDRSELWPEVNEWLGVSCAWCGADDFVPVDQQRGCQMVECRRCQLVYMNPRPAPQWLQRTYQDYLPVEPDAIVQWNRMMEPLYRSARRRLIGRFPAGGRLLDVGCGYGRFLEIMRAVGWQVEGLEVCGPAAAACQRRTLQVQPLTLAAATLPAYHYDAATLFYVLEHLSDPLGGLRKIHAALKPGGLLMVRFPHTTPLVKWLKRLSWQNELYHPPYHLFDFSPSLLRRILREIGFQNVRIEIDAATRPTRLPARFLSMAVSWLGRLLWRASGGHVLLPGVSKTALAEKPPKAATTRPEAMAKVKMQNAK